MYSYYFISNVLLVLRLFSIDPIALPLGEVGIELVEFVFVYRFVVLESSGIVIVFEVVEHP